jgi:hypothetical protein
VLPTQPRQDLTYAAKLEILREQQKRWSSIPEVKPTNYPLQDTGATYSSIYEFYGGVYARGSAFNRGTRRLDLYQLPSVNKGIEYKHWAHEDLGIDARDFTMEPDFDLLVMLEMGDRSLVADRAPGAPNATQYFNIHLRSLQTCLPHPDAAQPVITHSLSSFAGASWSFYFQVVGRYLAVLFLIGQDQAEGSSQLKVWDWTTGNAVTVRLCENTELED